MQKRAASVATNVTALASVSLSVRRLLCKCADRLLEAFNAIVKAVRVEMRYEAATQSVFAQDRANLVWLCAFFFSYALVHQKRLGMRSEERGGFDAGRLAAALDLQTVSLISNLISEQTEAKQWKMVGAGLRAVKSVLEVLVELCSSQQSETRLASQVLLGTLLRDQSVYFVDLLPRLLSNFPKNARNSLMSV
jgi:hypothetical protein